MALTTVHGGGGGGRILSTTPTRTVPTTTRRSTSFPIIHRHLLSPVSPSRPRTLHIALAKNKVSPRTGKFDSKNRRGAATTTTKDDQEDEADQLGDVIERVGPESSTMAGDSAGVVVDDDDEAFVMPELPGDKPGFWEGPQWDALGFFVQYMWAFGVVFALIACGIAVVTYNEGATDFKETPAYKESVQSRELLEEPDANSDVFESNPTEMAPSLD